MERNSSNRKRVATAQVSPARRPPPRPEPADVIVIDDDSESDSDLVNNAQDEDELYAQIDAIMAADVEGGIVQNVYNQLGLEHGLHPGGIQDLRQLVQGFSTMNACQQKQFVGLVLFWIKGVLDAAFLGQATSAEQRDCVSCMRFIGEEDGSVLLINKLWFHKKCHDAAFSIGGELAARVDREALKCYERAVLRILAAALNDPDSYLSHPTQARIQAQVLSAASPGRSKHTAIVVGDSPSPQAAAPMTLLRSVIVVPDDSDEE